MFKKMLSLIAMLSFTGIVRADENQTAPAVDSVATEDTSKKTVEEFVESFCNAAKEQWEEAPTPEDKAAFFCAFAVGGGSQDFFKLELEQIITHPKSTPEGVALAQKCLERLKNEETNTKKEACATTKAVSGSAANNSATDTKN